MCIRDRSNYRSPLQSRFRWSNWAKDPEGMTGEELIDFVNNDLFPSLKQLATKAGVSCLLYTSNFSNLVVVSPDIGGVVRARALAKQLEADLAIIDKRRPRANVSEVMNIIGEVDGLSLIHI